MKNEEEKGTSTLHEINLEQILAARDRMLIAAKKDEDKEEKKKRIAENKVQLRDLRDINKEELMACCFEYFTTGDIREIAKKRRIDLESLSRMQRESWWQSELRAIAQQAAVQLKVKLTRIIGLSLDQLEDRITNGDYKMDADGNQHRVPVQAQVLASITNVIFEKKKQMDLEANGVVTGETARLLNLAAALKAKNVTPNEVIDADIIEGNIHDSEGS